MLFEYILFSVHQLQIDCESELLLFWFSKCFTRLGLILEGKLWL